MPTTAQLLKAFGHLPNVEAKDLGSASIDTSSLEQFLENRICGHPDVYDQEIAMGAPDELSNTLGLSENECTGLIEAHKRMGNAIMGESRIGWPKGCHGQGMTIKYFLDRDTFPDHYKRPVRAEELNEILEAEVWGWTREQVYDRWTGKPMLDVAYALVAESYARVGVKHIEVNDGPNGKEHQVHIKSVNIPGSTIGVGWFPNGSCSDHVNQHIDSSYRPGLMGTAKLGCHEFGHNHGEEHQFGGQSTHHGVMSYDPPRLFYGFSTGKAPYVLPKDPSLDSLYRKYGGPLAPEPVPPVPPSGDLPTKIVIDPVQWGKDSQGRPFILNEVKAGGRTFIFRPKPVI